MCVCVTGDAQFSEATGYPMMQQWRVRSNLYRVKLSAITLSSDFSKVLKSLTADSTRDELLAFIQQYGSHYISEALYGSELTCNIYFPSKKSQQQLWLQYQKGKTEVKGSRRREKWELSQTIERQIKLNHFIPCGLCIEVPAVKCSVLNIR
ncbi:Astrotactin-2 [Labeo rohita]|uniref:Astrotactin-2 n=1 Tax=Labeo rohita TaxID=84645 RepID=A0ABQ8MMS4_LABRO|nr:Astrotactin-2 [Labeo rohita]